MFYYRFIVDYFGLQTTQKTLTLIILHICGIQLYYIYRYTPLQVSCFRILFLLSGNPLLNLKTMPNVHLCACDVFCIKWLIVYYFLCRVPRTCNGFAFVIATTFSLFYTMVNRYCRLRQCKRIIKCWIRDGRNRVVIVLVSKEKVKNGIFFKKYR